MSAWFHNIGGEELLMPSMSVLLTFLVCWFYSQEDAFNPKGQRRQRRRLGSGGGVPPGAGGPAVQHAGPSV